LKTSEFIPESDHPGIAFCSSRIGFDAAKLFILRGVEHRIFL
jgi:hypothetical protein